jgi:hypothetical protein
MRRSVHQTRELRRREGRTPLATAALLFGGMTFLLFVPLLPAAPVGCPHDPKEDRLDAGRRAVGAANAFLASLDDKQRTAALLPFDSEKKSKWSNLPTTFVPRNGVKLGDLSKAQRTAAMDLLAAVLSKDGYQKVIDIMDGDQQLVAGKGGEKRDKGGKGGGKGPGGRGGVMFGSDLYYLSIFGKPSETEPWMVQFGGHHLGVNVTVAGKEFVVTPTHTGAQPAFYKRDVKDVRPLGHEADAAFNLVNSLD